MSILRKNRHAFRPTLDGALEDRVVLSHSPAHVVRPQAGGLVTPRDVAQVRQLFNQQFNLANQQLRTFAQTQIANAFRNGRPTAAQLADLNNSLSGAINATALRLSAQANLLPGSARLTSGFQNSLLGNARNNLFSRLSTLTNNSRLASNPAALTRAVNGLFNSTAQANNNQLSRFFDTNNFNRTSVSATTGQPIGLNQFMGQQAQSLANNSFGALRNAFITSAQSGLFANGARPTAAQFQTFAQQQLPAAFNAATFPLASALQVLPGATNSTLIPQLRSSFLGNGTTANPGLRGLLTNLGSTGDFTDFQDFQTRANTAFTGGFTNFATPLSGFFGQTTVPTSFPTSNIPSLFGSNFTGNNFFNGFNAGFGGTGLPGFGTAPTGFNTNFGTGYNSLITGANPIIGTGFGGTTTTPGGFNTGGTGTGTIGTGSGGTTIGSGGTTTVGGFVPGSMGGFFA